MECRECLKQLNEMTLFCDRCGTQVSEVKMNFDFNTLEKHLHKTELEYPFSKGLQANIRNAYFLSKIKQDYKGYKLKYINQYIDYTLLRIYYEKNTRFMMTKDFSRKRAFDIYNSLVKMTFSKDTYELLDEIYTDEVKEKIIPQSAIKNVEKVYKHTFEIKKINPGRYRTYKLGKIIKAIFKSEIILAIISALAYVILSVVNPTILDTVIQQPLIIIGLATLFALRGIFKGSKQSRNFPVFDAIKSDQSFKKHINTDLRKKLKTLKGRIKKGGY